MRNREENLNFLNTIISDGNVVEFDNYRISDIYIHRDVNGTVIIPSIMLNMPPRIFSIYIDRFIYRNIDDGALLNFD